MTRELSERVIHIITYCFTGHRPTKLGGYDWNSDKNLLIMQVLRAKIIEQINSTCEKELKFICGGALGIDQMAFEICAELRDLTLKSKGYKIELELAIPFEKQASKWFNKEDITRYNTQKLQADKVTLVDRLDKYAFDRVQIGDYHPVKMQRRNRYMVDNSTVIIAVWNGSSGGTANCVKYASDVGKEITVINPDQF